jgi:hypothetical protein
MIFFYPSDISPKSLPVESCQRFKKKKKNLNTPSGSNRRNDKTCQTSVKALRGPETFGAQF